MKFSKRGMMIAAGTVVLMMILFALPMHVPYSISAPGKILARREWIVSQGADGRIVTRLLDRAKGVTNDYTVTQFERGDAFVFRLNANIEAGTLVRSGDTVGVAHSSALEQELARLKGEQATSTALLAINSTGDKQSIIEEARQQIIHAERNSQVRQAILERQKSLFDRNLISQQEYDLAGREASLAAIEIEIAKARLQSVSTGAKREMVEFNRASIRALQREIDVIEQRRSLGTLVAPLTGIALNVASNDTLLIVADTSEYVVVMPVHIRERSSLSRHLQVSIRTREMGSLPTGTIVGIDHTVYILNGEQVIFVTAALQHDATTLVHGLAAQCKIECEEVQPREFVSRTVRAALR